MDFKKNAIKMKESWDGAGVFLLRKNEWILGFFAIMLLGYWGYLWYAHITNPQWSASQEQQYINSQERAISFDQKKFDAAIDNIAVRKNEYGNSISINNGVATTSSNITPANGKTPITKKIQPGLNQKIIVPLPEKSKSVTTEYDKKIKNVPDIFGLK